jgi:hypothetical protein
VFVVSKGENIHAGSTSERRQRFRLVFSNPAPEEHARRILRGDSQSTFPFALSVVEGL